VKTEIIPPGVAVFRSENANVYQCPMCLCPLFSTYEGPEVPVIVCRGPFEPHRLEWPSVTIPTMDVGPQE
jgi:hypothetical protein